VSFALQERIQQIELGGQLQKVLPQQVSGLTRLHNLSTKLASTYRLDEAMQAILESIVELHGTHRGLLSLFDPAEGVLYSGAAVGFKPEELSQLAGVPPGAAACGSAFRDRCRVIVDDTESDPLFAAYREQARRVGFRAVHSTPLLSRDGTALGVLSVHFDSPARPTELQIQLADMHARQAADFLERLRAEEALKESRDRLTAIFESSPESIQVIAPDGTLLDLNPTGCRMLQASHLAELLGKSVYEFIAPQDRDRFRAMHQRVCAGVTENMDFQIVGLHGARLDVQTHAVPFSHPRTGKLQQLAITRDITSQTLSQQAQRYLAAVVESSDDAIVTKDLNGIITSWNNGAERLFGYSPAEVIGKPVAILIPQERENEEPEILAKLRRGQRIDHYETVRRRKDGKLLDISLTVSAVRDSHGRIIGASKIARDITELRRTREALTLSRLELEKRVQERTASLQEAIAQMEEFSYSVSHDLRAPVRAMKGYALAALEDYGHCLDARGRNYLERVVRSSSRMERLIHDVLTYSRLARCDIQLQRISLQKLIPDIIQQYPEMQPPQAEIRIRNQLEAVLAHEPLLSQAISNLLSNGVKFVALGVMPILEIWTETRNGRVRLWIEDNGIGIKPEHQRRLFGMFERVHQNKQYEGTGIGLAIVRKAVDRMGGTAGVESDGITGSSFWIELAAAE
jgi:PAS domain S-box-containing protein